MLKLHKIQVVEDKLVALLNQRIRKHFKGNYDTSFGSGITKEQFLTCVWTGRHSDSYRDYRKSLSGEFTADPCADRGLSLQQVRVNKLLLSLLFKMRQLQGERRERYFDTALLYDDGFLYLVEDRQRKYEAEKDKERSSRKSC